jgi:hypothetical protein
MARGQDFRAKKIGVGDDIEKSLGLGWRNHFCRVEAITMPRVGEARGRNKRAFVRRAG